jgi:hypothetical protein
MIFNKSDKVLKGYNFSTCTRVHFVIFVIFIKIKYAHPISHTYNKGNNKITELRTILQRESQNS